jgi:hypothetical protein
MTIDRATSPVDVPAVRGQHASGVIGLPEGYLEERRRKGLDGRDEMWEGVLHLVPAPSAKHQGLGTDLPLLS